MKLVRNFSKTCYSDVLVSDSSTLVDNEREDGSLITEDKDGTLREPDISYHGGLGLKFRFPGDPKKCVGRYCQCLNCVNFLQASRNV